MSVVGQEGGGAPLPGCLITLEGGEGSGKTTQCGLLVAWLATLGLAASAAREPGGTRLAERLREILLDPTLERLRPEAEVLLFAAARAQAVAEVIAPRLAGGGVVLCDRFVDSSLAYQGYGLGVDSAFILAVNARVTLGVWPDLTLLLDVPREIAARRRVGVPASADRIERRADAYHEAVRHGYLALAAAEPRRWVVIDAADAPGVVQAQARRAVATVLHRKGYALPAGPWADGGRG